MILFHHRAEIGCGRRIRAINCAFKERRVARYSIPHWWSRRELQPHQTGLKVSRSSVASAALNLNNPEVAR